MSTQFIMDFIGLPEFELIKMTKRSEGWTAILRPTERCYLCPICGGKTTSHKVDKRRTLRHRVIPYFGFVWVDVPIVHQRCCACSCVWSVEWNGIPQRGKVTDLFKSAVISMCHGTSIQSAAISCMVPYTTVERWYYEWAEEAGQEVQENRMDPMILCLDDFALRKGHQYAISIMDYHTKEVIQVTKGRSRDSIQGALKKWPYASPDMVITDLAPGVDKTLQAVWPKVKVAADPFHVIQLFTRELDHFRKKRTKQETSQRKRRQLTRLLTTNPRNLKNLKELLQVEEWLSKYPELDELYQSLQGMRRIYRLRSKPAAKQALDIWIKVYLLSGNSAVRKIVKTVLQWREPILNAMEFQVSNGPMEGINNKIKLMKRIAYGYRNIEHFERRIQIETALTG